MSASVSRSYRHCRQITRRSHSSFPLAFLLLPRKQRDAMTAVYAFLRIADDISDAPYGDLPGNSRLDQIESLRRTLHKSLDQSTDDPLFTAVADTIKGFEIPRTYFDDVLDGVAMDLSNFGYETFDELAVYCHRVASAVGKICLRIWSCHGNGADALAENCGLAFQLTNILRDLREDALRGRVYLPREELRRFGCDAHELVSSRWSPAWQSLLSFQIERADALYEAARGGAEILPNQARGVFSAMFNTYRTLLHKIRGQFDQLSRRRIHMTRWEKLHILARAAWSPRLVAGVSNPQYVGVP